MVGKLTSIGIPLKLVNRLALMRRYMVAKKFIEVMRPLAGETMLDVGGPGVATRVVEKLVPLNVFVLNIEPRWFANNSLLERYALIVADGCRIPMRDKSIDYVFSDNVIEHILKSKRKYFIKELMRVSKRGLFLTTPNYWFPYEPHYRMPFWQYLPESLKKQVLKRVAVGWQHSYEKFDLLTADQLRALIPSAEVEGISFGPIPETLVTYIRYD